MIKVLMISPGATFIEHFDKLPEIGDTVENEVYFKFEGKPKLVRSDERRVINRAVFEKPVIKDDPIVDYQAIIVLGSIIHKSFPNGEIV